MQNQPQNTQELLAIITAILTLINVVATIVYVVTTIFIAKFSRNAIELSRSQLEKLTHFEEERTRPYVLFNIISTDDRITQSQIKNYGLSAAFDVQVSLEPPLKVFDSEDIDTLSANSISMLPPGHEIVSDVNSGPGFHGRYPEPIFGGSVTYKNSKNEVFTENIYIDLTFMKRKYSHDEDSIPVEIKKLTDKVDGMLQKLKTLVKGR